MFMTVVWFRFLFNQLRKLVTFRSQLKFPQPFCWRLCYRCPMENPATWASCKWHVHGACPLGSAESLTNSHGQGWSKEGSNQEVLQWHDCVFPTWSFAWQDPKFLEVCQHLWINSWTESSNHHSMDLSVIITIPLDLMPWRFTCLFGSVESRNYL